jgi:hypothetical protein
LFYKETIDVGESDAIISPGGSMREIKPYSVIFLTTLAISCISFAQGEPKMLPDSLAPSGPPVMQIIAIISLSLAIASFLIFFTVNVINPLLFDLTGAYLRRIRSYEKSVENGPDPKATIVKEWENTFKPRLESLKLQVQDAKSTIMLILNLLEAVRISRTLAIKRPQIDFVKLKQLRRKIQEDHQVGQSEEPEDE